MAGPAPPRVGSDAFATSFAALTGAHTSVGNDAEVLINGDRIFPAMLERVERARRSVNLLTYVYWTGDIAERMAEALCAAAARGVACRVLLDAFGSRPIDEEVVGRMAEAGVEVRWFRPLGRSPIGRANNRNHRKVLVVDGLHGFTGGVGIAQEWEGDAQDPEHWRETHVHLDGPCVAGLQAAFTDSWLEATGEALGGGDHFPAPPEAGRLRVAIVRSHSRSGPSPATIALRLALAAARERVMITSGYFTPGPEAREALCAAAKRGVEVRIIVPGPHTDKPLVRDAGRDHYAELLSCGVAIFEYQPTMIHAKTITVDGDFAVIGSINLDPRSHEINEEVAACIHGPEVAGALDAASAEDLRRCLPAPPQPPGALSRARRLLSRPVRGQL